MTQATDKDQNLLIALQRGVQLTRRPFAAIADTLASTEADVLRAARDLFDKGIARRFGAVFDSRRLGYGSTLCAVDVPEQDLERVAALLHPHPGVTHCYERQGRPNLWFTLTAPAAGLETELRRIQAGMPAYPIHNLPALKRFKVEVVLDATPFDAEAPPGAPRHTGGDEPAPALTESEKEVVRTMQGNMPLSEEPFSAVAQKLGWDSARLLDLLSSWKQLGILRRVAIILRHRAAGFSANGMCIWKVGPGEVEADGRSLAECPEVTHCYERPPVSSEFPYNLFAMVHAREKQAAEAIFRRLTAYAGLGEGRMLMSTREFKKSSPVFFCEGRGARGEGAA